MIARDIGEKHWANSINAAADILERRAADSAADPATDTAKHMWEQVEKARAEGTFSSPQAADSAPAGAGRKWSEKPASHGPAQTECMTMGDIVHERMRNALAQAQPDHPAVTKPGDLIKLAKDCGARQIGLTAWSLSFTQMAWSEFCQRLRDEPRPPQVPRMTKPWVEGEPSECDGSAWDRLPPLVTAQAVTEIIRKAIDATFSEKGLWIDWRLRDALASKIGSLAMPALPQPVQTPAVTEAYDTLWEIVRQAKLALAEPIIINRFDTLQKIIAAGEAALAAPALPQAPAND